MRPIEPGGTMALADMGVGRQSPSLGAVVPPRNFIRGRISRLMCGFGVRDMSDNCAGPATSVPHE